MKWNVYHYNVNANKIEKFNIFKHYSFNKDVQEELKKCKTKEEFEERLKSNLRYYFWSKCEYELVVEVKDDYIYLKPWVGCKNPEEIKIDVTYDNYDWKGFAEKHTAKQRYGSRAKIDIYDQVIYIWEDFLEYLWNWIETNEYIESLTEDEDLYINLYDLVERLVEIDAEYNHENGI